jgi:hypothetical protein
MSGETNPGGLPADPSPAADEGDDRRARRPGSSQRLLTPAVAAALLILAVSAATSFTWVVAHGGVELPNRSGPIAGAGQTAWPPGATANPDSVVGPSDGPRLPNPTDSAAAPSPPAAEPSPTIPLPPESADPATPGPLPTSDRYTVLSPCPATPSCYLYTVRRGDNLWSIARWFGVPLDTVYELNPELRTTPLRPGTAVILPPPTR